MWLALSRCPWGKSWKKVEVALRLWSSCALATVLGIGVDVLITSGTEMVAVRREVECISCRQAEAAWLWGGACDV